MTTITVAARKIGVFQDWLKEHPRAAVTVEVENYEEDDDRLPPVQVEGDEANDEEADDSEDRSVRPQRNESRASTGTTGTNDVSQASQSRKEDDRISKERNARLVRITSWNPSVPRIGPYNVTKSSNGVKIPDLKAVVHHMEEATKLSDLERFKKYQEDGFILIKGAFNTGDGKKRLKALREKIVEAIDIEHGIVLDEDLMEEVKPDRPSKKKRAKVEVDKTVRLFPALTEEEIRDDPVWSTIAPNGCGVLDSPHLERVVKSFCNGASQFHGTTLAAERRFGWARMRGRLNPRKEWTEYFFFKMNEQNEEEMKKWDRRYAREITRRRENAKPRYALSAWVAVGPNPIDGGNLALLPGSHLLPGFLAQIRRDEEVPNDFRKQAREMPWVVSDLEEGDVLLVDMQTTRAYVSNRRSPAFVGAFADSMLIVS